jgi:hypothetical protein
MAWAEEEIEKVQKEILSVLRRKRFYTLPKVRVYPPCEIALNKLIQQGLVLDKSSYSLGRHYVATNLLIDTCIVRNIESHKIKPDNYLFIGCQYYADYNERWYEGTTEDRVTLGYVTKVTHKTIAKDWFERLTFKKSHSVVEIEFGDKKMIFEKDTIFNIVRNEY